ncbi:MAG: peptide deformylase [Bacilli bacterium]|nr:peptide deformylase [Bacilli bacterium]
MELPNIKILDEKNKILRTVSKEVVFPLDKEMKDTIYDMIKYLKMSQNEKYEKKYKLRAGMGLAMIQIGIPLRIFVIANENEDHTFEEHIIINPTILSESEEMIYVGEGEGCLSVNRPVDGIVPRHARINVEYYDIDGNKQKIRVREDIAIAFQHEIDHLNGILFVDKIDPKDPFKGKDLMREI